MRACVLFSLVLSLFAGAAVAQGVIPERRMALIRDVDLPGGDIQSIFDTDLQACQQACLTNDRCVAFTFNTRSRACFPKATMGEQSPYSGAFSGRVIETPAGVLALGEARAAELSFLREGDLDLAREVAVDLTDRHVPNNFAVGEFLRSAVEARAQGNMVQAYRFTGSAVVLSDAADHWVEYARLALAIDDSDRSRERDYHSRALAAAVNGYLRAEGAAVRHSALVVLAEALEENGRGRDMIPALRLAQEIQSRDDTEERLDDAIGKYGFRVVEHSVDNDAARPRICAEFSEDLVRAGMDYAPYVQVPEADLTVEPDQRRLCLEGVVHGERYRVTFRAGLPAASGEELVKSVTLNLYVRDRSPAVRFPGRAYVLPATGAVNIPVETVNVDEIELVLRKISDRSIIRAIQDGYFGRPLSPWEAEDFGATIAATVWEGTGEVQSELNRDVTTRLPLDEVVDRLEPGIYALQAAVPNADPYDNPAATQWFVVSDLGLATMSGTDGLHVFVRGLGDAEPEAGVTATLLSRSNAVLGTAETDAMGYARFEAGLTRGTGGAAPAMVLVEKGSDLTFLSLTDPEFDLSDRGVEGREPAGRVDAFLTTDRGAYRAGETIHATVLTRDATARAIDGLPVIAILTRPDGVEYARQIGEDAKAGGHVFHFRTTGSAPRGAWRLDIHADPDSPAIASTRVLVEDFLPERIDFDLSLPDGLILATDTPPLTIDADYLFGTPAGDLAIEGSVTLKSVSELGDFPGYVFGRHDDEAFSDVWYLPSGLRTDAEGEAVVGLELPDLTSDFRPRELRAEIRVSEGSGRPVERDLVRPVAAAGPVIGIKPNFDGTLAENTDAAFSLIALDAAQQRTDMQVRWTVNRVETRYQWYSYDGYWDYEPVTSRTLVAEGEAFLDGAPVTVTAPVEWGRYEIRVERVGGDYVASSTEFFAGWYGGADAATTPDVLEMSLDAETYAPGEIATVRVVPRHAGKGLITVVSNRLIDMKTVDLAEGENTFDLPVTDEWGAGVYVTVAAIRPTDVDAGRNPARSLGLTHAAVDPGEHALDVAVEVADEVDPRGAMPVAVNVAGVAEGETAWVTIAAVDVGILNITGFEAPDPSGHYFGQRKLGMGLRDVYGRLIDGLNGSMGNIRSGGDGFGADVGAEAPPPTEELVAFFSGPLEVGADGYARTEFELPSFNGTVKVMAVAWSDTGVGAASRDVLVRDPVVVTASLPRFMTPGDASRLLLEIAHASGPAGRMGLDVAADGVTLTQPVPSGFTLEEGGKQVFSLPITAQETIGVAEVQVVLTTPSGKVLTKDLKLNVQVNDPVTARASRFELAAGDTFTFDDAVFAGFRPGTGTVTLAAGPIARLDAPGLLAALDRYPYGCTEQTTSRALPLLYLDEVASAMGLAERDRLAERIDGAIERVLTRQAPNGAFGLWRASSGDFWLDAYVTDFLSRAKARGLDVPDIAFRNALDNLRNRVNYAPDFDAGGEDIAYALYVLAREGAAAIGDLRYYADVKADAFATPLAVAQVGAALAAYGDPTRADRMFALAGRMIDRLPQEERQVWRADYGTHLRDRAAVLTLAAESGSRAVDAEALLDEITPADAARHLSTQEQVWSLLAAHAMLESDAFGSLSLDGEPLEGPLVQVAEDDTAFRALAVRNDGERPVTITLTTFGVSEVSEPASGNGYAISRRYFDMQGNPARLETVKHGTRLVAVLTVEPFGQSEARLIVDDPLPAGFEIDNPNLMRGGDIRALDWLDLNSNAENTEFRQDRFIAAVDWRSDEAFRLGYVVRAVSPGKFHHPAALVEDMYRPEFRATSDTGRVVIVP